MSVLEDILEEFFEELNDNEEVPNDIVEGIKDLIQNNNFSSENLLDILKSSDLNDFKD